MSSKDRHLSDYKSFSLEHRDSIKVSIIVSSWNEKITTALLQGCKDTLIAEGMPPANIFVHQSPGSFELPLAAKWAMSHDKPDAVICLGCIITGETKHDVYISQSTANGIMQLGLMSNKPVIFGVLTPNNMEQALARSGGKYGNKGVEAAQTALNMIALHRQLGDKKSSIGFGG